VNIYKQEVLKYTRKDAIMALCLFIVVSIPHNRILATISVRLLEVPNVVWQLMIALFFVVPVIILLLINKQGLSSIGFHRKHLWSALRLGLIGSIIPLLLYSGLLAGIFNGWEFNPPTTMLYLLLIIFIAAAREDIAFVYIQTRLYGLIKNDRLAVFTCAVLFALFHAPFRIWVLGWPVLDTLVSPLMIGHIGSHIVFNMFFRKYFSIFSVILIHTIWNFSAFGGLWAVSGIGIEDTISFIVIMLALIIWVWLSHRSVKKKSKEQTNLRTN